jgi:hypothetical protein
VKRPKIFQLLQKISGYEHKVLHRYIQSEANCPRRDVKALYQFWHQNKQKHYSPEIYWKHVHPNQEFHVQKWRLLINHLQQTVDQYLAIRSLKEQPDLNDYLLLLAYRKRQMPYFFRRVYKKNLSRKGKTPYDIPALLHRWQLEDIYYDYLASPNRKEETNLQEASDAVDVFFVANKLKQACLAHSRYLARQESYQLHLLPQALDAIGQQPALLEVPAIAVYYACYQAVVKEGGLEEFKHLRQTMEKYEAGFSRASIRDIYLLAANYCIRQFNEGTERFAIETLAIYRTALEKGLLIEDGFIAESTFTNIVMLGIHVREFDWASDFIQSYAAQLPVNYRTSLEAYSRGRLFYAMGHYKKAMRQLAQVSAQAPFLYLGTKIIQIKASYESGAIDTAEQLLNNLNAYLQRHKRLSYRRAHYLHMAGFMRRLIQLPPIDKTSRQQLIADIKAAKSLQDKQWFLLQLGEN